MQHLSEHSCSQWVSVWVNSSYMLYWFVAKLRLIRLSDPNVYLSPQSFCSQGASPRIHRSPKWPADSEAEWATSTGSSTGWQRQKQDNPWHILVPCWAHRIPRYPSCEVGIHSQDGNVEYQRSSSHRSFISCTARSATICPSCPASVAVMAR